MKSSHWVLVAVVGVLALGVTFWTVGGADRPILEPEEDAYPQPSAALDEYTISGKVVSHSDALLSIEIGYGEVTSQLDFVLLETGTRIDGELREGAMVEVTYRTEGDRSIASNIRVVS
jgi:hypothetical protein